MLFADAHFFFLLPWVSIEMWQIFTGFFFFLVVFLLCNAYRLLLHLNKKVLRQCLFHGALICIQRLYKDIVGQE